MKRRITAITTLAVLLLCGVVWARGVVVVRQGASASCNTPTGGVFTESFGEGTTACYSGATGDDATCDNTWTVVGDSVTWHHTLQAGGPTGVCTYGLLSDTANEAGERAYLTISSPPAYTTTTDFTFSFYLNSWTVDTNASIGIVAIGNNNTGVAAYTALVQLNEQSGNIRLRTTATSTSTPVQIAIGTWYTVTLHLDSTAANSYMQVVGGGSTTCDAASECTFTRTDNNKTYAIFGSISGEGAAEAVSFEIGYSNANNP